MGPPIPLIAVTSPWMQEEDKRLPSEPSGWLVECPSGKDRGYKPSAWVQLLRECFYSHCELYGRCMSCCTTRTHCFLEYQWLYWSPSSSAIGKCGEFPPTNRHCNENDQRRQVHRFDGQQIAFPSINTNSLDWLGMALGNCFHYSEQFRFMTVMQITKIMINEQS